MKSRLTLKFMLKATLACIPLTLIAFAVRKLETIRIDYFDVFEGIAAWIVLLVGWVVYFLDLIQARRKKDENDEKAG